jgi:HNH endonuclease
MKKCYRCKLEKNDTDFGKAKDTCKKCRNEIYFIKKSKICCVCGTRFLTNGRTHCSNKCNILGNIEISDRGCWEWQKGADEFGYGHFRDRITGKTENAHRISYKVFKGEIPKGIFVCHSCDNPKCCNPDHLWAGTCKENMQDAKTKGRTLKGNKFRAKLSESDIIEIRKSYGIENSYKSLGKKYGVESSNIRAIIKRRSWKNI